MNPYIELFLQFVGITVIFTGIAGFLALVMIKRESKGTWKQALLQLFHET